MYARGVRRNGSDIQTDDRCTVTDENEKFIGGAERARREARKRSNRDQGGGWSQHAWKRQKGSDAGFLPKSMTPSERFFASLFMSSVSDIERSNESDERRAKIVAEACSRLGLPLPAKLPPTYKDGHQFYSMRASLILEESRCILSDALLKKRSRYSRSQKSSYGQHHSMNGAMRVRLLSTEERQKTGHFVLTFEKCARSSCPHGSVAISFTPREMYDMRPGVCFKIVPPGDHKSCVGSGDRKGREKCSSESYLLASVVPQQNYGSDDTLSLLVFKKFTFPIDPDAEWKVVPLTTLISQVRQFEACMRAVKVTFLPKLLAWKDGTHTRFYYSDDGSIDEEKKEDDEIQMNIGVEEEEKRKSHGCEVVNCHLPNKFSLPTLNHTQKRAADTFLSSPSSTLTLVQGPPGTGKTTFLVSVIARSLMPYSNSERSGQKRRILVTAPTNKAITVLATRFLDAITDDTSFNVVLIGVEDKLVSDGEESSLDDEDDAFVVSSFSSSLRGIFVYTWMQSVTDEFRSLKQSLDARRPTENLNIRARRLQKKLVKSIPGILKSYGAFGLLGQFVNMLEDAVSSSNGVDDTGKEANRLWENSRQTLSLLISILNSIDESNATQELLATADVIFCTLSTSGVAAMKQTKRIDDLLVDEAAAATEPEICIPFHLDPSRMLAVGDPMQLPATVMSRHAMDMGLDKSMHERLMFECGKLHIMLDVQYRMHPQISALPSSQFYGGKLCNGANVSRTNYQSEVSILKGNPYLFLQIEGYENQLACGSYENAEEALAVVHIVRMLHYLSVRQNDALPRNDEQADRRTQPWYSPDKIRIITFYQGQVSLIRRLMCKHGFGRVLVATVDSSQGCEADITIVSFVRSNNSKGSVRRTAGFLTDDRRMNVALTRARHQLICVGNARGTLRKSGGDTLRAIIEDAERRQLVSVFDPKSCSITEGSGKGKKGLK